MTARKIVAVILAGAFVFVLMPPANAQNPWSTAAMQAWKQSITTAGHMGAPRYTTALLPTCNSNNRGALAFDTTLTTLVICNATQWSSVAGGATGTIAYGNLELQDRSSLAAESLNETDFATTTKWTAATDFAFAGAKAVYTHSAGSGTVTQTSANGATAWAAAGANSYYKLTYTTSSITGAPVCTVPSTFALAAETLNTTTAATYTTYFKLIAGTVGDFVISCTSGAAATVSFDDVSLKRVTGGDLTANGRVLVGAGTAAAPAIAPINLPSYGISFPSGEIAFSQGAVEQWRINTNYLYPLTTDADGIGLDGNLVKDIGLSRSIQGSKAQSLTDAAAAVASVTIPVATSGYQAGELYWNAQSTDATDFRTTTGSLRFAGVNKAGAPTCTVDVIDADLTASSNANTLVCTWTNVVSSTNCVLSVTCTDNTAGGQTITINRRANMTTTATLTFN